jgi:hypothetical protein
MARIFNEFAADIFNDHFRWLLEKTREENAYLAGAGRKKTADERRRKYRNKRKEIRRVRQKLINYTRKRVEALAQLRELEKHQEKIQAARSRQLAEKQLRELEKQELRERELVRELETLPQFGPSGPKPKPQRAKKPLKTHAY